MLTNQQARWLRRLSVVPRWSVVPMLRTQSVAEHSFHTCTLALWLCRYHRRRDTGNFIRDVLVYAHTHDIREAKYGDHPSPSKKAKAIDPEDQIHVVLKCADIMEAIQTVHIEVMSGNTLAGNYIPKELFDRLGPWWNVFEWDSNLGLANEAIGKPDLFEIIEEVWRLAISSEHPHPAVEEIECYPVK